MPCKPITHACLVLGVELTVHGSREALEPGASGSLSVRILGVQTEACAFIGEILRTISIFKTRREMQVA